MEATVSATSGLGGLMRMLSEAGYARTDAPLLQPASVFLDLSGEDMRRRLYLTSDAEGRELCLRPEFTIPLCRDYIAGPTLGLEASLAYEGPVFRHRLQEPGEFRQAGVESLGREDRSAADAEIACLAVASAAKLGRADLTLRMGDIAILEKAISGIGLPAAAARRLKRDLAAGRKGGDQPPSGQAGIAGYNGVLKTLAGAEPKAARAFVEDLLRMAGVEASGGRSAAEIADRFLSRAGERGNGVSAEQTEMIERFTSIDGDPDQVAAELRTFAADTGIDLAEVLDRFEERTGFMAAGGLDIDRIRVSAGFARSLEYYTGMVFELVQQDKPDFRPLIGGGRYDRLLRRLGAPDDIPAVGFAIRIERIGPERTG
jgi:ATP phosphoribosyltransferase regulatory subunit